MRQTFAELVGRILSGDGPAAAAEAARLVEEGATAEQIVVRGLEPAMEQLDEKCTFDQFNLLEIMLAGRAVNAVTAMLFPGGVEADPWRGKVVLATLEGDVHDLGKKLVQTVLSARAFGVVDAGRNCSVEDVVACVRREGAGAVGISGLLTLVIPQVKRLREALHDAGLGHVAVIAGGAALKQASTAELDVDFVAQNVFEGVRYLEARVGIRSQGGPSDTTRGPEATTGPATPHIAAIPRTPLDIIMAAVRFQPAPRLPVVPQIFGHAAARQNVPLLEYRTDGGVLAGCQLDAWREYGGDAVFAAMDLNVECEALGAELDRPRDAYASILRHPFETPAELLAAEVPDPEKDGRMPEALTALDLLSREVGDRVLVSGLVVGPASLAAQLLGLEKMLFLLHDDPSAMEAVFDFCGRVAVRFGRAQIARGAHVTAVVDSVSSSAVLPPVLFHRFALPVIREIFRELFVAGARARWLHITGPTQPILPLYAEAGVDIANFDYCVDAAAARLALPHTALDGNVRPLSFVEGTPASVAEEVRLLRVELEGGGGWIVSSGCEIPPEAKPENIHAFIEASRPST